MKRLIVITLASGLLAGCRMLPAGDPPGGNIVNNAPPSEYSERGAEDMLITSLAGFMLLNQQLPRVIRVDADGDLETQAIRVINGAGKIVTLRYAEEAPLVLRVSAKDNLRSFQLYAPAKETVLWQEQPVIKP